MIFSAAPYWPTAVVPETKPSTTVLVAWYRLIEAVDTNRCHPSFSAATSWARSTVAPSRCPTLHRYARHSNPQITVAAELISTATDTSLDDRTNIKTAGMDARRTA